MNFKRMMDLSLVLVSAPLSVPLIIGGALAIAATSKGNPFFIQERVGQHGKTFSLVKLRSMYKDAEDIKAKTKNDHVNSITFKNKQDPRITPVGKIFRKTSLDELPQLWNVLRGDMSIVGPRPPLPQETKHYSDYHKKRLVVKPGLTCLWQISGRSDVPFEKQVELDLEYIRNQNIKMDLKIILKTVPAILTGKGAY